MKKALLGLLFGLACIAADETIDVIHVTGDPALTTLWFYLSPTFAYSSTGSANAQFTLARVDPISKYTGTTLSGVTMPLLTAITGSTSAQSINIPDATDVGSASLLIDGGNAAQEVVAYAGTIDSTHISGIARNNHSVGAPVQVVYSAYSKFLTYGLKVPVGWSYSNITNLGLVRANALPQNVYDQYRTFSSGAVNGCAYTEDAQQAWPSTASVTYSSVPQYSSGSLSTTGNPTNAIAINAGPASTTAALSPPCVQVQIIFTSTPEPAVAPLYQMWWDRN